MRCSLCSLCFCLGLVLAAPASGLGQGTAPDSTAVAVPAAPDSIPPEFLILPVVNYSEMNGAHATLLAELHAGLEQRGVRYVSSEELRPLLRHHRIRSRGWIGLEAARILRRETRARYLILGSWDVYRAEGNPEVGFSLRVMDLEHLSLISATSVGMTGDDFTGFLGLGRVDEVTELAARAMKKALDSLFPLPEYRNPRRSYRGCFQVALIPFDNFSSVPNAGNTMTNIVLSQLMAAGYFVVEPGFVRELGLTLEVISRGGLDHRNARSILASFDACRVLTGAVEQFSTARIGSSVPEVAVGIRVMSPAAGNLYMMDELHRAGDDGEGMFKGGRIRALIPLTNRVLRDYLEDLLDNNREDILYGDSSPGK